MYSGIPAVSKVLCVRRFGLPAIQYVKPVTLTVVVHLNVVRYYAVVFALAVKALITRQLLSRDG